MLRNILNILRIILKQGRTNPNTMRTCFIDERTITKLSNPPDPALCDNCGTCLDSGIPRLQVYIPRVLPVGSICGRCAVGSNDQKLKVAWLGSRIGSRA